MRVAQALVIGLLLLTGCMSPKHLSRPANFAFHMKGLHLEYKVGKYTTIVGEIIAVNDDSIMLMPLDTAQRMFAVSRNDIAQADIIVALTSDTPEGKSGWAAFINVLSLSHGYYMVFSAPLNLIITSAIAKNATKSTYRIKYPEAISWEEMRKFARFPQGIPTQVDRSLIR